MLQFRFSVMNAAMRQGRVEYLRENKQICKAECYNVSGFDSEEEKIIKNLVTQGHFKSAIYIVWHPLVPLELVLKYRKSYG